MLVPTPGVGTRTKRMNDPSLTWRVRDRVIDLGARPLVMGIVNVTPDSFSDGGEFARPETAVAHALGLIEQGADLLDLGGESTRPGATPVSADDERARVLPVVEQLVASGKLGNVLLSIDTSKAVVAEACLSAGAHVINDVTAFLGDAAMTEVARRFGAGVILMHMKGTPQTMSQLASYEDVVDEVAAFLEARLKACAEQGIAESCLLVDPGIGFAKMHEHSWTLLAHLAAFHRLGRPLCLGVSRKGFLGRLLGRDVKERMVGSLAVVLDAVHHRAAHVLRVHDVAPTVDAVRVLTTLAAYREKRT
jgi:dihydropteroate synthase